MQQAGEGLSSDQLLDLFEQSMRGLWNQASLTLGDITLSAVVNRVLFYAAERFPPFEIDTFPRMARFARSCLW